MFVVTANYRDRSSQFCWLIRDENQPAKDARACKRVEALGVEFIDTGNSRKLEIEEGFGCRRVAMCQEAQGFEFEDEQIQKDEVIPEGMVKLTFGGYNFYHQGEEVDNLVRLELTENRNIYGELVKE